MADEPAVETSGLTKRYGSSVALDGLDLQVRAGEVLGYLGPNGAGKSTTISLLLGLLRPTAGSARVLGLDPWRDAAELHRRLAYVPSVPDLWPRLTAGDTLTLLAELHGSVDRPYRDQLVERFGLDTAKRAADLSHGNRQKVLLVAALASRAELLLLDEPTSGLDPLMEQEFRACVVEARDRGQAVLLSSHVLSEVEAVADRVAMLRGGRLIDSGDLDLLRSVAAVAVEAQLDRPAGADVAAAGLDGVTDVVLDGATLRCSATGPIGPLLAVLTDHGVTHLLTTEPSLEQLFLARYGQDGADDPRPTHPRQT